MKPAQITFFAMFLAFLSTSQAVEIKVLPGTTDRLEIRPIQLPGGGQTTLYIVTGNPVRLTVDGDLIVAEYIEFDSESRILRIVGPGHVAYENVVTQGQDYLLDLGSGELNFQDVFIVTAPLDIEGVEATRLPGQIDISGGIFSPCSRCEQPVQDYRFRAETMNLYPGDRLVAFNVTIYIRELPSFFLPLLVVPLGPEERRPRFNLERGASSNNFRASAALDWPYVVGASAFGTASLRYFADVTPGGGSGPAETIFGGSIDTSYLGGGIDHRFYTERGRGRLGFFYTPPFIDEFEPGSRSRDEYTYTFAYETEEALAGLQTALLLERDDPNNPRIFNLTARLSDRAGGFGFRYVTQTYLDLEPTDSAFLPSYEESEGALHTYGRLQVGPDEGTSFSAGPFTLSDFELELGFFEDYANASNQSALASPLRLAQTDTPIIRGGRLLERHTITLAALSPFPGSSLSGSTSFAGQYYTTRNPGGEFERLVDWTTTLSAEQDLGVGTFGVDLSRVILEGETPFRFDARTTPNSRTALDAELSLQPLAWLDLNVSETYVFEDSRSPDDALRAGPLETRVELFNNLDWFGATLEQSYDLQENDPGLLGASVRLTSPDAALRGSVRVDGVYDLLHEPDRTDENRRLVNESEVDLITEVGYSTYAALDVRAGYEFSGDPDPFDDSYEDDEGLLPDLGEDIARPARFKPLEVGVSAGTLAQEDALPGLRVFARRDLNDGKMDTVGLELAARLGPVELGAQQAFDFGDRRADDSALTLTLPEVAELSAVGFSLLPPAWLGLTPDPEDTVSYQVSLTDLTQQSTTRLYELSYATSYGPLFEEGAGLGFFDTSLGALIDLETRTFSTPLGPLGFGVSFAGELAIADAALPVTYFSSGSLELVTDFFSRVALQGGLEYVAEFDTFTGTVVTQSLLLDEFGPTFRITDDLYVSALFSDIWDFTGTSSDRPPFNLQPIIYVTLDRCCWALYGALNTEDGTVSLTLGYPGTREGLTGAFNSPFILPGRELP